eukprot:SAG31_NODE_24736_length_475_cov_0.816489_1_plen_61_part_01
MERWARCGGMRENDPVDAAGRHATDQNKTILSMAADKYSRINSYLKLDAEESTATTRFIIY